jgi:O-antigen/teichoic acid export membrane protein
MADARTIRTFAGLAGGEAMARALAFAATLLVARRLGPAMYGVIGVSTGIMLYLNQVADGGIELSGVPAVARQRDGLGVLVSSTLTVRLIVAAALTAIVVVLGLFAFPQPDGAILALYALGLVFVAAGTRWVFLGLQQATWVAAARITGELTALAIVVLALRDVGDVAVVPVATIVGAALAAFVMLAGLRSLGIRPSISFQWETSRPLFARGPHLVGFTLLGLVLFNADLIYLRFISGQEAAGYYAAAYTFIAFAANLSVAWAHSVMPALARVEQSGSAQSTVLQTALLLALTVTLPVAAGGMLVALPLIRLVFGADYVPAVSALIWLLPSVPLAAMREVIVAGLIGAEGGERALLRVNAIAAIFNIAILLPVVPRYGVIGAASVTVLTEVLRLAVSWRYAVQGGLRPPRVARFVRPIVAASLMVAGLLLAGDGGLVAKVAVGVLLYAVGLLITGVLRIQRGQRPVLEV